MLAAGVKKEAEEKEQRAAAEGGGTMLTACSVHMGHLDVGHDLRCGGKARHAE